MLALLDVFEYKFNSCNINHVLNCFLLLLK
jgi:hypothetical protein